MTAGHPLPPRADRPLSIVTFNVGLLSLFGGAIRPTPFIEERLRHIPDALRTSGADIVLLQEIYREPHRRFLADAVRDTFPYVGYVRLQRWWQLANGLMAFARMPIRVSLNPFRAAPLEERLFDQKGTLVVETIGGDFPPLRVLNTHTTAGGLFSHPEQDHIDCIRDCQLDEVFALANRDDRLTIIAGDLNAGPSVSRKNFLRFAEHGFLDAHAWANGADVVASTWDPANPLNAHGPHRTSPPQRIDHVFVRQSDVDAGTATIIASEIIFREPVVPINDDLIVTLSDHFGIRTTIHLAGTSTNL